MRPRVRPNRCCRRIASAPPGSNISGARGSFLRSARELGAGKMSGKMACRIFWGVQIADKKAAGRRVHDEVARLRDCTDQPRDQADGLDVWVRIAIDLLDPAARNAPIAPRALRSQRLPLQHQQIVAPPPRAIAVADAAIVRDQVNALDDVCDSEVLSLA